MSASQSHGPHDTPWPHGPARKGSLVSRALRQAEPPSHSKNPPKPTPHWHFTPRAATRTTVLVVDDDNELLTAVAERLSEAGYRVLTANNGTDALVRIERDRPDVVVLDIVMPYRSGVAVLQRLARAAFGPKIVLTTASRDWDPEYWVNEPNVVAFLPKPFDADTLLATLQAVPAAGSPASPPGQLKHGPNRR